MGDFAGGLLKYLRVRPVARVTIAGGPAKMTKLSEGMLDLHSKRGAVDLAALAARVAEGAWATAARVIAGAPSELEIVVIGRDGRILASSGFQRV